MNCAVCRGHLLQGFGEASDEGGLKQLVYLQPTGLVPTSRVGQALCPSPGQGRPH